MIIIVPYKAPQSVQGIQNIFTQLNCLGLGVENEQYLSTKELTSEEKANRRLDFLGGFEIMDKEFRIFVIEGIGGQGNAMDTFYKTNERERPNDKKFKLLYNPSVKFKERKYLDFDGTIKKIKLQGSLSSIISNPEVFLRHKVPEDMFEILTKLAELRQLERLHLVRDFNLLPDTANLLTLERKYGDLLNYEDLLGVRQKRKRKIKVAAITDKRLFIRKIRFVLLRAETKSQGRTEGVTEAVTSESKSVTQVKTGSTTFYRSDAGATSYRSPSSYQPTSVSAPQNQLEHGSEEEEEEESEQM
jgi:hypothetical protein